MKLLDKLKIELSDVISCDLYDTLVFRCVKKPDDVFSIIEKEYNHKYNKNLSDFYIKRKSAERNARMLYNDREDIVIDEIYECYNGDDKNILKEIEKEVELNVVIPNFKLVSLLNSYHAKGKKVVITSDMYLDETTIRKIIEKTGIIYDSIYLSSSIGKLKSTGNLFRYVKDKFDRNKRILHIGDNFDTDIKMARENGIQAILYKDKLTNNYDITSLIEKNIFDMGYNVYGLFLYNFCMYIHKKCIKHGLKKIVFCARDGYLIHKCHKKMYPSDDAIYLFLNRNIIRGAVLYIESTLDRFWDLIQGIEYYTVKMIIETINPIDAKKIFDELNNKYDDLQNIKFDRFEKSDLITKIFNFVIEKSKDYLYSQYYLLLKYLKQNEILDSNFAIINNSTNGTCQYYINQILSYANIKCKAFSLQFVDSNICKDRNGNDYLVYFKTLLNDCEIENFIYAITPFELLLFPIEGTPLYLNDNNGIIGVVKDVVGSESENEDLVSKIEKYALKFIDDYYNEMNNDNELAIRNLYHTFAYPDFNIANIFSALNKYDINGKKIINVDCKDCRDLSYTEKIAKGNQTETYWKQGLIGILKLNPKITVIIPFYNVGKYISNCIKSVLSQTFFDFELILIDDASTDDSYSICDEYRKLDNRIILLRNDKRLGASKSRNRAIIYARGEYIVFVDADDYIDFDLFEKLYESQNKYNADLVITGFYHDHSGKISNASHLSNGIYETINLYIDYPNVEREWGFSAVIGKLFKKEIIERYNVFFKENISIFEDMIYVVEYLKHCCNYCMSEYRGYYYRHYDGESLTKSYDKNSYIALKEKINADKWIIDTLDSDGVKKYFERLDFLFNDIIKRIKQYYNGNKYSEINRMNRLYNSMSRGKI